MSTNTCFLVRDPKPIAVFFHCVFQIDGAELPAAVPIVREQMRTLRNVGLLDEAKDLFVGVNGGEESLQTANEVLPRKALVSFHGTQCRNELRTLLMLEQWLLGHEDWYVLWHHSKGATHEPGHYLSDRWRGCMMKHCVVNWRQCVADLDAGFESVGCHWMSGIKTPPGQSIWAGTFFWAKASFLLTLPSVMKRDRIKLSGLDSIESRYEAEVWIGNGPRLPRVKDYHPNWDPSKIATCTP